MLLFKQSLKVNLNLYDVFCLKGTNIKDVVLSESAPSTLLLDKHIAFIVSYSKKTDDYVCSLSMLAVDLKLFSTILVMV